VKEQKISLFSPEVSELEGGYILTQSVNAVQQFWGQVHCPRFVLLIYFLMRTQIGLGIVGPASKEEVKT
jgi:hypothetical protein